MATTVDLRVFSEFRAGDSLSWSESWSDYPADQGWVLTYRLVGSAGTISFTSTNDNGAHLLSVTSSTTSSWSPGFYDWTETVEQGSERITLDEGSIQILANPATETGTDKRSHARKVLDAIRAVLEGRASKDQESYSINGRTLNRTPVRDLTELERIYAARVTQEERRNKAKHDLGSTSQTIRVRF